MVRRSPPVMHDLQREAGTHYHAVAEESLWMLLPCGMGDLSGLFLETWSWTGSWSWLVHAENISHASEALPHLNSGTKRF